MTRVKVVWTDHHRRWEGDEWAGSWIEISPPVERSGVVDGYVVVNDDVRAVIVDDRGHLQVMSIDDIAVSDEWVP